MWCRHMEWVGLMERESCAWLKCVGMESSRVKGFLCKGEGERGRVIEAVFNQSRVIFAAYRAREEES